MQRRTFLTSTFATTLLGPRLLAAEPKKVAAIMTVYRPNSHSDVLVGKYMEGWLQKNQPPGPRSKLV